jgi:hypothetical protein
MLDAAPRTGRGAKGRQHAQRAGEMRSGGHHSCESRIHLRTCRRGLAGHRRASERCGSQRPDRQARRSSKVSSHCAPQRGDCRCRSGSWLAPRRRHPGLGLP